MQDTYLPAAAVRERYQCCDVTIWRWMRSPKVNFPKPALRPSQRHRLWSLADLRAWEATRVEAAA